MTGFAFRQNSFALGHALANFAYAGVLSENFLSVVFRKCPRAQIAPASKLFCMKASLTISFVHILFSLL